VLLELAAIYVFLLEFIRGSMISISRSLFAVNRSSLSLISVLLVALAVAGCGEKEKNSQVAAKVNAEEITVSQVGNALAVLPVVPGKTADEARKEVLENLIVQKLAIQQAVKMKLDRTPAVMQAIESSKNTILARAYMDPIVEAASKVTSDDVHKFYTDHPELFSARRVYNLRELEVQAKPGLIASMRDWVAKGQSMDAIAAELKSQNSTPAVQNGVKSAEQLPMEMVSALNKLSPGQLMVIELTKSISVLQVVSFKVEPVDESVAGPAVHEYLVNTRRKESIEKEINVLKAGAKIEYVGEQALKPAASGVAEKPTQAGSMDVAKGVAGLK
jgi:EpsD family peptidyl-prolyl cis-trans isomerase